MERVCKPSFVAPHSFGHVHGYPSLGFDAQMSAGRRSFIWTDGYPPARLSAATYPSLIARRADTGLCLVLQGVGFTMPAMSPSPRCALTAPFHPYLSAVYFLWHFPEDHSRWLLAITLPCPARTFLPFRRIGMSDRHTRSMDIISQIGLRSLWVRFRTFSFG